jgi:hypothetical protein
MDQWTWDPLRHGEYNSCDKKCRKCHKSVHEECSRQVQMSSSVGLDSDVVICSTNCYKSLKPKTPRLWGNLPHPFIGREVAFSPQEEPWMDPKVHKVNKVYADIGSMYLVGIVSRAIKSRKKGGKKEELFFWSCLERYSIFQEVYDAQNHTWTGTEGNFKSTASFEGPYTWWESDRIE